ncbi:MAG: phenylalanine--tRNA ligase subunit alpha [Candidatus Aenigmarchaeota archaeon]|nr:phenylalanine--tRNA ligase subunit alpha [Candidatus Aenigmarchaeota archaeon]MDW8149356.1 phenylalanine--tRNA ligase subunit alpha [Candidatus Aenigmarchaeota archaeon]
MIEKLSKIEKEIIKYLKNWKSIEEIELESGKNQGLINRALFFLENKGLLEKKIEKVTKIKLTNKGEECLKKGFPEEILFSLIKEKVSLMFKEIPKNLSMGLKYLKDLDLIEIEDDKIKIKRDFDFKNYLIRKENLSKEELELAKKRGLIKEVELEKKFYKLNEMGLKLLSHLLEKEEDLIDNLTHEIIIQRKWIGKKFREYDVLSKVPKITFGKRCLLNEVAKQIREVWISMGFEEMVGDWVTTSLFNFDVMFFSQDHPDRELMGTYYLEIDEGEIDERLVKEIKKIYKKYKKEDLREEETKKLILRTHTTAISFQYLYRNIFDKLKVGKKLKIPGKYFCIGRVFRVDVFDYKHLPEFHQIEGFVIDKNLSFKDLLYYLKTFYEKMGIEKIKFKPVYNPYTEPSAEIFAWLPNRNDWFEVGNSGIFRRECLDPLGIKENIIAWGLALERIAMLLYDINDIRFLHGSQMKIW